MAGYRVSVEAEDALDVDAELCASQWMKQRLLVHTLITVVSMGLWLPGFVIWLMTLSKRKQDFASAYTVRVDGGQLTAGNQSESRSIPLDAIVGVSVSSGVVTIAPGPGQQPFQLYGLKNPSGAARVILEARDQHLHRDRKRVGDDPAETSTQEELAPEKRSAKA